MLQELWEFALDDGGRYIPQNDEACAVADFISAANGEHTPIWAREMRAIIDLAGVMDAKVALV